jgi:hypothetical protein
LILYIYFSSSKDDSFFTNLYIRNIAIINKDKCHQKLSIDIKKSEGKSGG